MTLTFFGIAGLFWESSIREDAPVRSTYLFDFA